MTGTLTGPGLGKMIRDSLMHAHLEAGAEELMHEVGNRIVETYEHEYKALAGRAATHNLADVDAHTITPVIEAMVLHQLAARQAKNISGMYASHNQSNLGNEYMALSYEHKAYFQRWQTRLTELCMREEETRRQAQRERDKRESEPQSPWSQN